MLPFWAVSLGMLPRIDGKESIPTAQRAYMQEQLGIIRWLNHLPGPTEEPLAVLV